MLPPIGDPELRVPRYHFNVEDGESIPDLEGAELPDLASARAEAVRLAGRLLDDDPQLFCRRGHWRLVVADPSGAALFGLDIRAWDGPTAPARAAPA